VNTTTTAATNMPIDRLQYARRRLTEALAHCEVSRDVMAPGLSWGWTSRARVYARMAEFVGGSGCTIREIAAVVGYDEDTIRRAIKPTRITDHMRRVRDAAMHKHAAPSNLFTSRLRATNLPGDPRTFTEIREIVWWEMRKPFCGIVLSFPEIAAATSCRSHSSVIQAINRCVKRMERTRREKAGRAQPLEKEASVAA